MSLRSIIQLVFAFSLFVSGTHASAQDCAAILRFGIWEGFETGGTNIGSTSFQSWACSNRSKSTGIKAAYGDVVGGSFNKAATKKSCSQSESSSSFLSSEYMDFKTASTTIANAWTTCLSADGAKAYVKFRSDPSYFTISLQFKNGGLNNTSAKISVVNRDNVAECDKQSLVSGLDFSFLLEESLSCKRKDISKPVFFNVKFENGKSFSLEVSPIDLEVVIPPVDRLIDGSAFVLRLVPIRTDDSVQDPKCFNYDVVYGDYGGIFNKANGIAQVIYIGSSTVLSSAGPADIAARKLRIGANWFKIDGPATLRLINDDETPKIVCGAGTEARVTIIE